MYVSIAAKAQENSHARTYTRPAFLVPDARTDAPAIGGIYPLRYRCTDVIVWRRDICNISLVIRSTTGLAVVAQKSALGDLRLALMSSS